MESTTPFLDNISAYTSCLGYGGFGIVLLSVDSNHTETATKFLFPTDADANEQKQILRETTLTSSLPKHPNLVNILNVQEKLFSFKELEEIFSDSILKSEYQRRFIDMYLMTARRSKDGLPTICIQMELCGENLRSWLAEKRDRDDIQVQKNQKTIILNLVEGLKFLHDHKIIHRDLKPENIMFTSSGFTLPVKIGDFGLCRIIHNADTLTGHLTKSGIGTMVYMAPEIRTGQYTQQADFFSLGLIIWEVAQFVNVEMFDELVIDEDKYVVHEHPLMPGLPDVVMKLTKRSVKQRFQTWHELVNVASQWMQLSGTAANCMTVRNTVELNSCLKIARPGAVINLKEGTYYGPLSLKQNNVTMIGAGSGTILKGKEDNNYTLFEIRAKECTIRQMKLVVTNACGIEVSGDKNKLSNIEFAGGHSCMSIRGDENKVTEITVMGADDGIRIDYGNRNVIQGLKLQNVVLFAVLISTNCDHNVIKDVTGRNICGGISINGSYNSMTDIHLIRSDKEKQYSGVNLSDRGSNNTVNNLVFTGYSTDEVGLDIRCENAVVSDSVCEGVYLEGRGCNAKLLNVESGVGGVRRRK